MLMLGHMASGPPASSKKETEPLGGDDNDSVTCISKLPTVMFIHCNKMVASQK